MQNNSSIDLFIRIVLSRLCIIEFRVKVTKEHLDLGTTRDIIADSGISLGVIFTLDVVLKVLNKISDHIPDKLHLILLIAW